MRKMIFKKIVGVLIIIGIFTFSLLPGSGKADLFPHQDKLGHAFSYFMVTFWWENIIQKAKHLRLVLRFTLMGILIEYLQRQTGYRTFDYYDMLANFSGCLIAYFTARRFIA